MDEITAEENLLATAYSCNSDKYIIKIEQFRVLLKKLLY